MGIIGGFIIPAGIGIRKKEKGIQKLKWYCQSCKEQCYNESRFKRHILSETHLRLVEIFSHNPDVEFVEYYSLEFENAFLEHMKQCYGSSRVAATVAYNAYILDRHHVHMHRTRWATLNAFVCYLGELGKCKVEDTEKGKFITYTDSEGLFRERYKNLQIERASSSTGVKELCEGIVVKLTNKSSECYNKMGIVTKVLDEHYGEIMILDATQQHILLHQDDFEML